MDSDYLYIVATLTFISVFFIYFIYFQSRAKHTETDNGIECDGDKCFIEHKQNCQL
jgi:low temperature requirement protein LtrA